ncbi:MerR family transcriptional regulator [Kibdelosporangium phytohabitans]|uniref:MerR family transcriptional regulator n=1 Tax=Kibdelosporangium phytohabitans TaxID=860235 RepID=A0A0N9I1V3_9PSEU|nr:MerR family transcriptional regulator [Kibdelosporangium phytohabitans]ALG12538.1 MerR family transcriptional regulator [Kibdelosporangium phytohabitans]MBE1464143.1 DNA-binding transcriptional MerR regulator [Kibdelosporangium phytohabitans]
MRIGELAGLTGLSTRAIRHYHHRGLLPEPERRPNGYREYGLRDVVALARIRRLTELGLSLDEVRDALADGHGHDLREMLAALDDDLARQEAAIRARRARLATMLDQADLRDDTTISPELAGLLAELPTTTGPIGALERELFTLLDMAPGSEQVVATLRAHVTDPATIARGQDLARQLEDLADAAVDDPRIAPLAATVAESIPAGLVTSEVDLGHPFSTAVLEALTPAQAEVFRQAMRQVRA